MKEHEEIVISGISGRYPDCDSITEFWEKLVQGIELSSIDDRRWPLGFHSLPKRAGKIRDINKCDYEFFGMSEHDANYLDVQMRVALETTYEAIVDAGVDPKSLQGSKTALFAGICYDDTGTAYDSSEETALNYQRISMQKVAAAFDFRGGASAADTACASSFTAFYQAFYSIRAGLCDQAVVIGAAVNLRPTIALGFNNLRMTSPDGRSKCMDASADGYGRSEAVVSILLQKKSQAKRLYASIVSIQTNTDGFKPEGITYPSVESQYKLMKSTQEEAGIPPLKMKYIEAHMTGTPAGDVVESESITRTFCEGRPKEDPLLVGCLKSNLGHTEGASGTCSISKVCLAFENRELPPNLGFQTPNPNIKGLHSGILKPVLERIPFEEKVVGVSSFGFGGCNVYSILKCNERESTKENFAKAFDPDLPRIVLSCGRTEESVNYSFSYIEGNLDKVTNDFFSLLNGVMKMDVSAMSFRGFSIYSTTINGKRNVSCIKKQVTRCRPDTQPVWLAISGVSNRWQSLSKSLLSIEAFAKSISDSAGIALDLGLDLKDILFSRHENSPIKLSEAMVGIAATQIALIDLLRSLDVKIDGFIGHSIGEITCAYADGCLSREQTLMTSYLVSKHLMNASVKNGSTGLEWEEIGVHTDKVKGLYASIYESLSQNVFRHPYPMSKRTGRWISTSLHTNSALPEEEDQMSAAYFARCITSPNNFRNMLYLLPKNAVMMEVASQPILEGTLRRGLGPDVTILSMLKPAADQVEHLLSTLGSLYLTGNNVAIEKLYPKVEYPVPRGTLPISPLIKWDHRKTLTVTKYPEYFSVVSGVHSYDIDLMQSAFQYLSGHVIDGRNLCPAVEYLRYVWEVVAANVFESRDYMKYPIEFRKVRLMRGIMLSPHKSVEVTVKYSKETGAFETLEGGNLCCTGYAFIASEPSTESLEALVQPKKDQQAVTLDNKSIYKELRVRGYDYGNTFQGLVQCSSDGSSGKVKWMGHWVSFVDSMLQIAILGSNERVLRIPTYIEYVKCNSKIFMDNIEKCKDEMGDSIVDVSYDRTVGVGASKGIVIMGLKTSVIARRNAQQPVLESYRFSPYEELDVKIPESLEKKVSSYENDCRTLLSMIRRKSPISEEIDKELEKKYPNTGEHSILHTLLQVVREENNSSNSDDSKSADEFLQSKLKENTPKFSTDLLISSKLDVEAMTRHQVDIILENTSSRDIKVLEMNLTTGLLADKVTDLLAMNLMQTTYTVMHSESSASLNGKSSSVSSFIDWKKAKSSLPSDVTDQDVVIFRDDSCSLKIDKEESFVNVKTIIPEISKTLKSNGFFLLFFRSGVSQLEKEILGSNNSLVRNGSEITTVTRENGFEVISHKTCGSTTSLLLRKVIEDLSIKVIPITSDNYDWIEEVKGFLLPDANKNDEDKKKQQEKKKQNTRLWLTSSDSSSGLVGLVNCLRREPGCQNVRCYLNPSSQESMVIPDDIIKKDLVINVIQEKGNGSFRHSLIENTEIKAPSSHAYVDIKTKGDLSSFRWMENNTKYFDVTPTACRVSSSETLVKVSYASLNFKDVMIASGRISTDAYPAGLGMTGALLGMEFSGLDENGNRVMGYTIGKGMATQVAVLDPLFLWPVPSNWTLEEAATVPVVYATVYYGLILRARLQPGESVLIHSGAGGVGQAAINVCKSMGCQIFTTCSEQKRDFLKKTFGLEDWQIADSRSTMFEEHILRETEGRGVDVVLNSLSETKLKASVNCLADFGRFVEIGKYDIIVNNLLDMSQFGLNKAFQTTCLAHLDVDAFFHQNPSAMQMRARVYNLLAEGIRNGVVKPLQTHVYDRSQVEDAFRFMASGKHIGKVLIRIGGEEAELMSNDPVIPTVQQTLFHPQKSYIITGGLGGFGLELTNWMVSRGAKKIILTSRTGVKDNYQRTFLERLKKESFGAKIVISTQDITTKEGSAALIEEASKIGPIGGIFNLAMVLRDATLENQNAESFSSCCGPKVSGTIFLDDISRTSCPSLDYFICFSSVVSGRGNAGQTNYGYANSVMERVCEERRKDGLPGLAIQWGAIGDVGVVAEVLGGNDVVIGGTSVPQRIPSCLETLDQFLMMSNSDDVAVVSSIVRVNLKKSTGAGTGDLLGTVCHILGIGDTSSLDPNSTLSELGMDSLMAIEIKQGLEREFDIVLSTQEIRNMKVKDLKEMESLIKKSGGSIGGGNKKNKSSSVNDRVTAETVTILPKGNFSRLNEVEAGKPIFLFPPFEGSFRLLSPLCRHINRPVIGVNWTEEAEKIPSFKDVVAYFVHLIRQNFPDSTHDIMGYDFGGLIALEVAAQLHNKYGESSVTKIALIESSQELIKAYALDVLNRGKNNPDLSYNSLLTEYFSLFFPLEASDRQNLEADLEKFASSREDKLSYLASLFDRHIREEGKNKTSSTSSSSSNETSQDTDANNSNNNHCVDPILLGEAVERFRRKLHFSSSFSLSRPLLKVSFGLQRSTDSFESVSSHLDSSYNLTKVQEENQNLAMDILEGDHRSVLTFHSETIGHSLDSFFVNVFCA